MTRAIEMTPKGEDLGRRVWRIAAAALEVDRRRVRHDAACTARNHCRCSRACNVMGGGRTFVDPCWKNNDVLEGVEFECSNCRRRGIRHRAALATGRELAGARCRLTMLVRNCRREHGDVI